MIAHDYRIGIGKSEYNFSGLSSTSTRFFTVERNFKPTVNNVIKLAKELFPEYQIDTRYASVKEQIASGLDIGIISIRFITNDDFISYYMALNEII